MKHFFEPYILDYCLDDFPFPGIVADILNVKYLHLAHKLLTVQMATRETDQKTNLHSVFYNDTRIVFQNTYLKFLKQVVQPRLCLSRMIYQKIPNFRAHMPGSMAVGEFHKDTKYSHSVHEINIWMPLTRTLENNTIWIESYPDRKDYKPVLVYPGECLVFQGGLLTHGNKINDTSFSRISIDFRILDPEKYSPLTGNKTINTGTKLCIGDYFDILEDGKPYRSHSILSQ